MEEEIWKVYYEGPRVKLEISNQGRAKRNGSLLQFTRIKKDVYYIGTFPLHRAVAELFVINPNNYNEVDHINGNSLDNRAINLRWVTHKENMNNPITRKRLSKNKKFYWQNKRVIN